MCTSLVAIRLWLLCLPGKDKMVEPCVTLGVRTSAGGESCKVEKEVLTIRGRDPFL